MHLFSGGADTTAWRRVADATTFAERDLLWDHLQHYQPQQAAYLAAIDRTKWQTSELLALGLHTHNTTTNNAAEQVGRMLLDACVDEQPIRYRTPGPLVRGLLQLFNKQALVLSARAEEVKTSKVKYSDYVLGIWSRENMESGHYRVAQVGQQEWTVIRITVLLPTDKVRHVKVDADGVARCECNLYAECEVICRHIIAVSNSGYSGKWKHLAADPIGGKWLNSLFVHSFSNFNVSMPSQDEIMTTSGDMYPTPLKMPAKVRGRGRPRVKRIKRMVQIRKNKMRLQAGLAGDTPSRHCSVCMAIGHVKTTCPVRAHFSMD